MTKEDVMFKKFCSEWVDFCNGLAGKHINKYQKGRIKGDEFENIFLRSKA